MRLFFGAGCVTKKACGGNEVFSEWKWRPEALREKQRCLFSVAALRKFRTRRERINLLVLVKALAKFTLFSSALGVIYQLLMALYFGKNELRHRQKK